MGGLLRINFVVELKVLTPGLQWSTFSFLFFYYTFQCKLWSLGQNLIYVKYACIFLYFSRVSSISEGKPKREHFSEFFYVGQLEFS